MLTDTSSSLEGGTPRVGNLVLVSRTSGWINTSRSAVLYLLYLCFFVSGARAKADKRQSPGQCYFTVGI